MQWEGHLLKGGYVRGQDGEPPSFSPGPATGTIHLPPFLWVNLWCLTKLNLLQKEQTMDIWFPRTFSLIACPMNIIAPDYLFSNAAFWSHLERAEHQKHSPFCLKAEIQYHLEGPSLQLGFHLNKVPDFQVLSRFIVQGYNLWQPLTSLLLLTSQGF